MLKEDGFSRPVWIATCMWMAAAYQPAVAARDTVREAAKNHDIVTTAPPQQAFVWRNTGPAEISGRVNDIAVPSNANDGDTRPGSVIYVAGAGGLFRTTNGGEHWQPLLDGKGLVSTASDVAVAKSDPSVVWVATGDWNFIHGGVPGDGVYRSRDGGDTWTKAGFQDARYVAKVEIHPTRPDTVYVGVIGPMSGASRERGLYRTDDGGETWTQLLYVNEWTGVVDIAIDPSNPQILYAVTMQQGMNTDVFVPFGPGSGLWKSEDGGDNWRRLHKGLPDLDLGRCGIAVSAARPGVVYAVVEPVGQKRGDADEEFTRRAVTLYRSDDFGETWQRKAPLNQGSSFYWGKVWTDPSDADRVYMATRALAVSTDGGDTIHDTSTVDLYSEFAQLLGLNRARSAGDPKLIAPAADSNALWINPEHPDHLIMGNDHGIFITEDRGETWNHSRSLIMARPWGLDAGPEPYSYSIVLSMMDSPAYLGPSRTRAFFGIKNGDWRSVEGNENGPVAIDPAEPTTVYTSGTLAFGEHLYRLNVDSERRTAIGPYAHLGEPSLYRQLQRGALIVSSHDNQRLYTGLTEVWRSDTRGDDWRRISPTFDAQTPETVDLMGRQILTAQNPWDRRGPLGATVSALAESPLDPAVLYAGTRNGLLEVTRNGGRTWLPAGKRPGLPDRAEVSSLVASSAAAGRAYATFLGVRDGDLRPYIFRTDDYGASWKRIVNGLPPSAAVWVVLEHHRAANLLVAGTDRGAFASVDHGQNWWPIRGNLPAAQVRRLVLAEGANDLVAAVWGRGAWILDDIGFLEEWAQAQSRNTPYLFPVRDTQLHTKLGRERYIEPQFAAPNPPYGVIVSYHVPASAAGPERIIDIEDADGVVVRSYHAAAGPGLHRFVWDLRRSPLATDGRPGPYVSPGQYRIKFRDGEYRREAGTTQSRVMNVSRDPQVELSIEEERLLADQASRIHRADHEHKTIGAVVNEVLRELDAIVADVPNGTAAQSAHREANRLAGELRDAVRGLVWDLSDLTALSSNPPSFAAIYNLQLAIGDRSMYQAGASAPLPQPQQRLLADVERTTAGKRERVRNLLRKDFARLRKAIERAAIDADLNAEAWLQRLNDAGEAVITQAEPYRSEVLENRPYAK